MKSYSDSDSESECDSDMDYYEYMFLKKIPCTVNKCTERCFADCSGCGKSYCETHYKECFNVYKQYEDDHRIFNCHECNYELKRESESDSE